MPEIELDDESTAKTLAEHMADELAAERNKYDAMLAAEFIKTILLYAKEVAERAKEQSLRSLSQEDAARFRAWETLSHGTFFQRALDWRFAAIRGEYAVIQHIRELEAKSAPRKSDRHGNALGEYGLYQPPGIDPTRNGQTGR